VPVQVRVTMAGQEPRVERLLLKGPEARLPVPGRFESVVVNEGGHGFYRVRYAPELLAKLLDQVPHGLLPVERFNLANDAWAALLAGLMPAAEYLDLTARFRPDRDKNVWAVLAGSFAALSRVIDDADRPRLEALVRDRVGPAVAELGWEPKGGEDDLRRQLRGDLLRAVGVLGNDAAVQARAAEFFAAHEADPSQADANVWAAAVAVAAHAGDAGRYEDFVAQFRSARTPQEEQRFLHALALFRAPDQVDQTLRRALSSEVRTQDAPYLVRAMLMGVHSREAAWRFVRERWDELSRAYPVVGLRRMCEGVTGLARPAWEAEVRRFFAERKIDLGGKTLAQYLEQLRVAVALSEREGASLRGYLQRGR
jgi:puromycin-sensitive aminopeptidase